MSRLLAIALICGTILYPEIPQKILPVFCELFSKPAFFAPGNPAALKNVHTAIHTLSFYVASASLFSGLPVTILRIFHQPGVFKPIGESQNPDSPIISFCDMEVGMENRRRYFHHRGHQEERYKGVQLVTRLDGKTVFDGFKKLMQTLFLLFPRKAKSHKVLSRKQLFNNNLAILNNIGPFIPLDCTTLIANLLLTTVGDGKGSLLFVEMRGLSYKKRIEFFVFFEFLFIYNDILFILRFFCL